MVLPILSGYLESMLQVPQAQRTYTHIYVSVYLFTFNKRRHTWKYIVVVTNIMSQGLSIDLKLYRTWNIPLSQVIGLFKAPLIVTIAELPGFE